MQGGSSWQASWTMSQGSVWQGTTAPRNMQQPPLARLQLFGKWPRALMAVCSVTGEYEGVVEEDDKEGAGAEGAAADGEDEEEEEEEEEDTDVATPWTGLAKLPVRGRSMHGSTCQPSASAAHSHVHGHAHALGHGS